MLIAFCGIDGSGKTTQIVRLKHSLEQRGLSVFCTKEPTDWYRKDERVRRLLNREGESDKLIAEELALFAAADRLRHIQTDIIPNEAEGKIVITDRYVYSTYAYFMARGINDFKWLQSLNRYVPIPDLTFYLDVDPVEAVRRIIARDGKSQKKEETDLQAMNTVRNVFISQPWGAINNYHVIKGNNDIDAKSKIIERIVFEHIDRQSLPSR